MLLDRAVFLNRDIVSLRVLGHTETRKSSYRLISSWAWSLASLNFGISLRVVRDTVAGKSRNRFVAGWAWSLASLELHIPLGVKRHTDTGKSSDWLVAGRAWSLACYGIGRVVQRRGLGSERRGSKGEDMRESHF